MSNNYEDRVTEGRGTTVTLEKNSHPYSRHIHAAWRRCVPRHRV